MATKKIAILWSEPIADDNFYQNITRYITEWTEVSDEDYLLLVRWAAQIRKTNRYGYGGIPYILAKMDRDQILTTVQACKEAASENEKQQAKEEERRKQKALDKQKRAEEAEKKQYEKLRHKYG